MISSEEKTIKWQENIRKQQESGLPVKKWCEANQISFHVFGYWKKRLSLLSINRSSFVELNDQKKCSIDIQYLDVRIRFESSSLKQCLEVFREFKC